MNPSRKRAFTLIELLVVIGIISVLMAIGLPSLRRVRQLGLETSCKSNLRQMGMILNAYTQDNDDRFPNASFLYHSRLSFDLSQWPSYYLCCRWHDARMGHDSVLLREHPELRGSLHSYIGNKDLLICKVGKRANELRGCWNACPACRHDGSIEVITQYTYTMNRHLSSELATGTSDGGGGLKIDPRSRRDWPIEQPTQVTRSPAQVFAFGEENSWAVNALGEQQLDRQPHWPAPYDLSGMIATSRSNCYAGLRLSALYIHNTYHVHEDALETSRLGNAFATYHRPPKGDLNAGHSYAVMLDGHVRKVTVADQLRESRRVAGIEPGGLLPGGNTTLAWPIDVPPPGGWENQ